MSVDYDPYPEVEPTSVNCTSTLMFACHDCCGHGNEDGWCEPLAGEAVIP